MDKVKFSKWSYGIEKKATRKKYKRVWNTNRRKANKKIIANYFNE